MFASTFMWTYARADAHTTRTQEIAKLTTFMRTDFRAHAQTNAEFTSQLTAFIRIDFRADAHTTQTQEIAQLTTFMGTDVRADAQTIFALTAQSARSCSQSHSCGSDIYWHQPPLLSGRLPGGLVPINWHR